MTAREAITAAIAQSQVTSPAIAENAMAPAAEVESQRERLAARRQGTDYHSWAGGGPASSSYAQLIKDQKEAGAKTSHHSK